MSPAASSPPTQTSSAGPALPPDADELRLDDRVRLRKPHPCGSYEWRVTRLGADIGLRCLGCDRKVLLPRAQLRKRMKARLGRDGDGRV